MSPNYVCLHLAPSGVEHVDTRAGRSRARDQPATPIRARNSTATTRQPTALRPIRKSRHEPHTAARSSKRTHSRAQDHARTLAQSRARALRRGERAAIGEYTARRAAEAPRERGEGGMAACGGMEGEHAPLGERAGVERRVVAPRRACCERERGCDGATRSVRSAGSGRGRGRRAARRVRGVASAPGMRGERAGQVSGRMERNRGKSSLGSVRVRAVGWLAHLWQRAHEACTGDAPTTLH